MAERRYYNVVFKAVIEDLAAAALRAGAPPAARARAATGTADVSARATRTRPAAARPAASRSAWPRALTWLLKLDVVLFGGVRTGPFFGLLRPGRGA